MNKTNMELFASQTQIATQRKVNAVSRLLLRTKYRALLGANSTVLKDQQLEQALKSGWHMVLLANA